MKQKIRFLKRSSIWAVAFITILITSAVPMAEAARGASVGLVYPYPVAGALGYYSYDHEYIYAFRQEPDIQVLFGTSNTFDFYGSFPPTNVFIADASLLDPTNTDIELNGFTAVHIDDPSLSSFSVEAARAKAYFTGQGIEESQIGVIIVPQADAAALLNQKLYFTYIRHFGNNTGRGFDSYSYFRSYAEDLANGSNGGAGNSFQLVEPNVGLTVTKTLLTPDGEQADTLDVRVGDTVNFTVTIKNTSDIWLENIVLEDNLFASDVSNVTMNGTQVFLNNENKLEIGNLNGDPRRNKTNGHWGEEITVTYDYVVSENDMIGADGIYSIVNTATASGTTPAKSYDLAEDKAGNYPFIGEDLAVIKPLSAQDSNMLMLSDYEPQPLPEPGVPPELPLDGGNPETGDTGYSGMLFVMAASMGVLMAMKRMKNTKSAGSCLS